MRVYSICKQYGEIEYFHPPDRNGLVSVMYMNSAENAELGLTRRISTDDGDYYVWRHDHNSAEHNVPFLPPDLEQQSPYKLYSDNPLSNCSLHALDDACLFKLFEYLEPLDLSEMADVCPRFNVIAMQVARKTQTIEITKSTCLQVWKWEKYLRKFGPMMLGISLTQVRTLDLLSTLILEYCPNLHRLGPLN